MKFLSKIALSILAFSCCYSMANLSAMHLRVVEKNRDGKLIPTFSYVMISGGAVLLTQDMHEATRFTRKNIYESDKGWHCELICGTDFLGTSDCGWLTLIGRRFEGDRFLCWLCTSVKLPSGSFVDYYSQKFHGGCLMLMGENIEAVPA